MPRPAQEKCDCFCAHFVCDWASVYETVRECMMGDHMCACCPFAAFFGAFGKARMWVRSEGASALRSG